MKVRRDIPIYNVQLWIVVSAKIYEARRAMSEIFGEPDFDDTWQAMCAWKAHNFGLFFDASELTTEVIAHEVFHLTHRILEWTSVKFSPADHEAGALLHGYLMGLVTNAVSKAKR